MTEELYTFTTSDGIALAGVLAQPENDITFRIHSGQACIVLCHGITADKDEGGVFIELAEKLVASGFAVFRFDFRGHGESGGRSIDMTISGEQTDVAAAIEFLKTRGYNTFGLLGASFAGGAVSLYSAQHADTIKVLVLWNALIDYAIRVTPNTEWGKKYLGQPAIDRVNRLGYTTIGTGFFRVGKKLMDEMAVLEPWKALADLETPTLFVHGNKDTYIDYHDSVKYSLLMKHAQLEIIRGAEHGFHDEPYTKEVIEKVVIFLVQCM